jgi:dolichyl-phosphate beta-glucosyltransferase
MPDSRRPDLSIVIPAYNESRRIGPTLDDIHRYATVRQLTCEIIIVDDGSSDETAAVVSLAAARLASAGAGAGGDSAPPPRFVLLANDRNRGKGYSLRRGALAAGGERVLMCDADGSAPLAELVRLLPWLDRGYDVIIGSRDMPDSRLDPPQPLPRRLMAWTFRAIRRRLLVRDIRDTQCGFKLFRHDAAHAIFERCSVDGWLIDCEALAVAERLGYRVREVGIHWRSHAETRVRPCREAFGALRTLLAIRRKFAAGSPEYAAEHAEKTKG